MVDRLTPQRRSWLMSQVRGKDTFPELAVRKIVHKLGLRYRLHQTSLPGKPDLVLAKHRMIIFVNGCFWHRHEGCRKATTPSTRKEFWQHKFSRNLKRDIQNQSALKQLGWRVIVVWECETKNNRRLEQLLRRKLREALG
jgi:DNA mismatch endonuclease (patch repair protein)